MSEVKVNKLSPRLNCGTVTLGDSGDSFVIPSGVTITNNGTQTGFGRTGTVDWDTTAKTAGFTAVSGNGYFVNTTSGAITATLPAGSAGAIVAFADYANTFDTNNLTIAPNGTDKIGGVNANAKVSTEGASTTFVYIDSTQGWKQVNDATLNTIGEAFITATGGTVTCCGDYKIHTFTGPGTFCVSQIATSPANNRVSYLVVAGGAGGGSDVGGGGGAGGFREDKSPATPYTASPLNGAGPITVTATAYPITVGGGGSGSTGAPARGCNGSNSVFSTITSAGGGGGGSYNPALKDGAPGGSGGGGAGYTLVTTGGTGNTPPTSPPQGNNGGNSPTPCIQATGGGGGGATGVGGDENAPQTTFASGGAGATTLISASPTTYSTGGRGAGDQTPGSQAGAANTGDGGDGGGAPPGAGQTGGSGIVIIRYKYQ